MTVTYVAVPPSRKRPVVGDEINGTSDNKQEDRCR